MEPLEKIETLTQWCLQISGNDPGKFPLAISYLGERIDSWYPESDRFAMASAVIDNLILIAGLEEEEGLKQKCFNMMK
jgi:hypothetical protein